MLGICLEFSFRVGHFGSIYCNLGTIIASYRNEEDGIFHIAKAFDDTAVGVLIAEIKALAADCFINFECV